MYLMTCTRDEIKDYIHFTKSLYKDNPFYRDSMTSVLKDILYKKSIFSKDKDIIPVMVKENDEIVAVATYIFTDRMNDALQIAFFEARENSQKAVDMIVDMGKRIGLEKGAEKIIVGLDGHVNYGLGFLEDHFEEPVSFGNKYNPPYYIHYFKGKLSTEYGLTSFLTDMETFNLDKESKILKETNKKFQYRTANFNKLKKEIEIYTALNNLCFIDHPFYYKRTYKEDYELFKQFKLFLKPENLLIAEKNGEAIGFMLWYPDFHQLIPQGEGMGLKTYFRNRYRGSTIDKFKIVEIGILPAYQGTGAILGLFNKCMELTKDRYRQCETGWILNTNLKSKSFGLKWADSEYKHFKVFEISI